MVHVVCMCVAHTLKITVYIFMQMCVHVDVTLFAQFSKKKKRSGTHSFHDICFSKLLTFHNGYFFFLLLVAVLNSFRDFKPYFDMCNRCSLNSRKVLETATRSEKHETIVEGQRLRKADIPTTADRKDTRTDRRKDTVMHKTSRRTGTGTGKARRGTAQDSTGEQNRQGDTETTLPFRALHGNHILSIPFETIVEKTQRDVVDYVLK